MDERLVELLRSYLPLLGDEPLNEKTRLRDLGLDSLHAVDLLAGIEDTFEISLPEEDLTDDTFATAAALWRVIAAQLTPPLEGAPLQGAPTAPFQGAPPVPFEGAPPAPFEGAPPAPRRS